MRLTVPEPVALVTDDSDALRYTRQIVGLYDRVAEHPFASAADAWNDVLPAAVGVPDSTPAAFNARPVGNWPLATA
jgi:hypothetical protein